MKLKSQLPIFIKHPVSGVPSVSLTLLIISFHLLIGFGIAEVLGKVQKVGIFEELFYACAGLYFGRNLSFSQKVKGTGDKVKTQEKEE